MVKGRKCIAKAKTSIARRTLDPLYQQKLIFHEDYRGCVLQVSHLLVNEYYIVLNFSLIFLYYSLID